MKKISKIGIVGGGIVGLATAFRLAEVMPWAEIHLFEKEKILGHHQSSHNSGVLHCGIFYKPKSLKARLAVSGIRQMIAFCEENSIRHEVCGKLIVATNDSELVRLKALEERGKENGLIGLRLLSPNEIKEREPFVEGVGALEVPEEGIVDYGAVCRVLGDKLRAGGASIHFESKVTSTTVDSVGWGIGLNNNEKRLNVDFLINCAGLHCDRVCKMSQKTTNQILPFRGEYYKLSSAKAHLVNHLVYPVPDPKFPFLGVHFTRMIDGSIEAGPNAVLAFAREGYRKTDFNPSDFLEALTFPGLWRFAGSHPGMCIREFAQSFSKARFCRELQKLIPSIKIEDLEAGSAGVRAQAVSRSGELLQDFSLVEGRQSIHVLNAPSPAATASLAIGDEIATRVVRQLSA